MTEANQHHHFCITLYLFNQSATKTLLIKHKKLNWYLPVGGHIEAEEDYLSALKREAYEELGITKFELPDYLQPLKYGTNQPIVIQRNFIKETHIHDDLVFAGVIPEETYLNPADGESKDLLWVETDKIENTNTSKEVIQHVQSISLKMKKYISESEVKNDIYLYPRYSHSLIKDFETFVSGETFSDWNLGDLYTDVPQSYAQKLGAKYGIFCSTGTTGLHSSLISLGLKPGDEVVVPSMTFIRAITPLNHLQLVPVIADIDSKTGNLDPESVKKVITEKTKAVIVVHMWGIPADCDRLRKLCDDHHLKLIEDFSHAHYSSYKDKFVGSFGDVSFASLQRKKTISVGEGGIIVTSDEHIFSKLREITSPGSFDIPKNYAEVDFSGFGLNMRMSPFSAVVAKNLFSQIDDILDLKVYTLKVLTELIKNTTDKIILPDIPSYTKLENISWYSYKPVLNGISLDKLKKLRLWKFNDFGYGSIKSHKYWQKDSNYFPFNYGIRPIVRTELVGHDAYLKNRISLSLPFVDREYWSLETINQWKNELTNLMHD